MRERLFRGKLLDNSEWIYGNLLNHRGDDSYDVFGEVIHSGDLIIYDWTEKVDTGKYGCHYNVIPETVGQYTGLTDKNGTKIFEGDIVVTNKFGIPNRKYVIVYDDEIATYIGEGKQGCCRYFTTFSGDADAFEVIGNIHDNPELLKGGEG